MDTIKSFQEFTLPEPLMQGLKTLGFETPTPVQAQAIPAGLKGKDVLAIAPTGTGKTGAFVIPALSYLYPQPGKQILILAPTRELAAQINRFIKKLGDGLDLKGTLIVGGESYSRQRNEVKGGVDYIIATPGRLMDHINRGMPIENISMLVLDEVDRMLDMGFAPQVEQIVKLLPPTRQTFLFSATMPKEVVNLVNKYLKDPVRINVMGVASEAPKIKEENIETTDIEKPRLMLEQVAARTGKILVFANTQGRVEQVARRLTNSDHPAECIHGGRTHAERKSALEAFRTGEIRILVATDIVARGIDVSDIEHVINYDYPASHEDYLHRIGRTGRIGKQGSAITFNDPKRRKQFSRSTNNLNPSVPTSARSKPAFKSDAKSSFRKDDRPFRSDRRPTFRKEDRPFRSDAKPAFRKDDRPFRSEAKPSFRKEDKGFKPDRRPSFRKEDRPFRSDAKPAFRREERPFKSDSGYKPKRAFSNKEGAPREQGEQPLRTSNPNVYRAGRQRDGVPAPIGRKKSFSGAFSKAAPKAFSRAAKPWVRGNEGKSVRRVQNKSVEI